MKILVAIKRVVDYNVKVHVLGDNSGVDIATAKMSMNPFDEIAVEAAVRLKEAQGHEVVVVSVGPAKTVDTLRVGLAMGADRAIHVATDEALDTLAVAKLLKAVADRESPDLILMGKQAIDDDAAQVPQMLSALLQWPVATNASGLVVEGETVAVTRETDAGLMRVKGTVPCVVSADLRLAEPRYVTLPNMMKAKKKPIEAIDAAELGGVKASQVKAVRFEEPAQRSAGVKVDSVDALIDALKNTAKVL